MDNMHIGRSWFGNAIEQGCLCGLAACGLVDTNAISPECSQHPLSAGKTLRQMHYAENCAQFTKES